ncbi:hypothetical protein [Arthrobacter sp. GMC3]|uniref:hypothetical protein n=1 Tax=Arthrobacter sp. GMC3 TaxID=2058894 RepID=UPI000CE34A23|nr:hypothetical protein [Arthrobacter sp. GMC3]
MLRGRKDDGTWTDRDRVMALALTLYEDGLCSGCGLHHSVTHGDENVGRWEANSENICHGCEPIDAAKDADKKDTYPGQKLTLIEADGF